MTDSPREEPRPDRLREINWRLVRRYGYTGMNEPFGVSAMDADLKWLVAEVERLREKLQSPDTQQMADDVLSGKRRIEDVLAELRGSDD